MTSVLEVKISLYPLSLFHRHLKPVACLMCGLTDSSWCLSFPPVAAPVGHSDGENVIKGQDAISAVSLRVSGFSPLSYSKVHKLLQVRFLCVI